MHQDTAGDVRSFCCLAAVVGVALRPLVWIHGVRVARFSYSNDNYRISVDNKRGSRGYPSMATMTLVHKEECQHCHILSSSIAINFSLPFFLEKATNIQKTHKFYAHVHGLTLLTAIDDGEGSCCCCSAAAVRRVGGAAKTL
jgi:hypothetical protein